MPNNPSKDGTTQLGQRFDENLGIVISYTETMATGSDRAAALGNARTDVIPNDGNSAKVRVWGAIDLSQMYLRVPGMLQVQLPAVLKSVTITYNKSQGDGENVREVGDAAWVGASGGMNLNPTASASGSASILPDAQIVIEESRGQPVPIEQVFFFLPGSVTVAQVLGQLQGIFIVNLTTIVAGLVTTAAAHELTVNQPFYFESLGTPAGGVAINTVYYVLTTPTTTSFTYAATLGGAALPGHSAATGTVAPKIYPWPSFRPQSHTLTLKGEQKSLSVNAEASFTYRWSGSDVSYAYSPAGGSISHGFNADHGVTIQSKQIPPTIHGLITIADTSDTATFSVTAEADIPAIPGSGGAPSFVGTNSTYSDGPISVTGSVSPTSLAATPGTSTIPVSGLYIYDISAERGAYGQTNVRVTLVNFNAFA